MMDDSDSRLLWIYAGMHQIRHPNIVDVEASGFGGLSYPIEVGLSMACGKRYCALIKPDPHWTHWDKSAESVHGISREMLAEKGKPVCTVADELNCLLDGEAVYTDGWVVDEPWMIRLFDAAKVRRGFRMYDIQTIMSESQMDHWHSVKKHVMKQLKLTRHRASNDARIIQETFVQSAGVTQ
ncbi:MAG: hypothetical protein K6L80_04045 [Agarilytica sp.]